MPGRDRTGPTGMGPMTGRGAGYCAGFTTGGYANPMPGRGLARGRGSGRGLGRGGAGRWVNAFAYGPNIPPQEETKLLKAQASSMQDAINSIQARIKELESGAARENT